MKTQIRSLYAVIGALLIVIAVQATIIAHADNIKVIKHNVENGYHNVEFSFRDTMAYDMLPDSEYQKLANGIKLPSAD